MVGTSYQLGNLVSSASSTIESTIGERYPLPSIEKEGKVTKRYQYGKVICIFMACVYLYVIILTIVGPEKRGAFMDVGHDRDMKEAARDQFGRVIHGDGGKGVDGDRGSSEGESESEKKRVA